MKEIWKDIIKYKGYYQVSDKGNVKSLDRLVKCIGGKFRKFKGVLLKPYSNGHGYLVIALSKDGDRNKKLIHVLVWNAFGKAKRNKNVIYVDHKDNNSKNNLIENLQLLSHRENCSKDRTSRFGVTGVSKNYNKFQAAIYINGKTKHLGVFRTPEEAGIAYQTAVKNLS